jgi:hypothetical protein
MMRDRLRTCLLFACLLGLAILQYGWIIYLPLGTAMAILSLTFVLACLTAYVTRRTLRRGSPPDR